MLFNSLWPQTRSGGARPAASGDVGAGGGIVWMAVSWKLLAKREIENNILTTVLEVSGKKKISKGVNFKINMVNIDNGEETFWQKRLINLADWKGLNGKQFCQRLPQKGC